MTSLWQKTMLYLGLVDEEEITQEEEAALPPPQQARVRTVPTREVLGRRVEPPLERRRPSGATPEHKEAGIVVHSGAAAGSVRPTAPSGQSEVIQVVSFNDAQRLGDCLRSQRPAVLDLRDADPDMVRRLVDFAGGLTYALAGSMRKIAQGVVLVTPSRVHISDEETRRLADLGLYQANGGV